jgi:hypothetical protein
MAHFTDLTGLASIASAAAAASELTSVKTSRSAWNRALGVLFIVSPFRRNVPVAELYFGSSAAAPETAAQGQAPA